MKTEHKAPEMSGIFKELAENFISSIEILDLNINPRRM